MVFAASSTTDSDLPTVLGPLLGTKTLRFLKEPGSQLQTAFHQDMPFFNWDGDQAAVCLVPVDSVAKESGAMRYVKGSHKWPQYAPRLLISNETVDDDAADYSPLLPDNDEIFEKHEVLMWDVEPGDVIVHHPNCVHGSGGNTNKDQRRLAMSVRYIGDDVRINNKPTAAGLTHLMEKWHSSRDLSLVPSSSEEVAIPTIEALQASGDDDGLYAIAGAVAGAETGTGDPFDSTLSSRLAHPVVWTLEGGSKL